MRRSEGLVVVVLCPHFERPVPAVRNLATERLVDCREKDACVRMEAGERDVTVRVYPQGCPVFRAQG